MLILTFLAAIFLSGVAAYYSIIGLTLIFTGSFYAILTMGVSLEFSKLVATSWLYRNWQSTAFLMKTYMLSAILVLMLITSMGIFGFLSRSHLENSALSSNTVDNQIALLDSRIESRETYLARLQQQIDSIDESFNRYVELGSISRGITERKNFKEERDELEAERREIDDELLSLREQRALALNEKSKVEVEIGPLKYIAELIYAGDAEKHFDSAVRWVIILIVIVFDPLAIVLLLAANKSLLERKGKPNPPEAPKSKKEAVKVEKSHSPSNIKFTSHHEEVEMKDKDHEILDEIVIPDDIIKLSSNENDSEQISQTEEYMQIAKNSNQSDLSFLSSDPIKRRYQLSLKGFVNRMRKGV